MTQIVGTTWDMSICQVSITTGGVMSVIDERQLSARDFMVCEEFKLGNGLSRRVLLDEATIGGLIIVLTDSGAGGVFMLRGGVNDAGLLLELPANTFTHTLGTGSRANVDWNGSEYVIQNNLGAERRFRVFLIRGF
jgi:hypothetical protein